MKIVSFDDIRDLQVSPQLCYQWVDEMLRSKDDVLLPAKISMKPMDGVFCNVMPCIIAREGQKKFGGVKVVTRYPERVPSLDSKLLLMDAENGEFLALMDANWITAMRTGAVAAHSIMLLAKKNFATLGIMGLGNTARATMLVLASMMPEREFLVKLLKYKGQEESFAERFGEFKYLKFQYVDSNEELVKGSDVVISAATYLSGNVCNDECFDEGVLVVPIHTLGFTNCDLFFDKVFADDYGHVHHFKYFDQFKSFSEVSDVLSGKNPGRENDKERILAYNIGVSMHDINYAMHIYEMLSKNENIENIDLNDPTDKFWI